MAAKGSSVEELRKALHKWADKYNRSWLIERHGFLAPMQIRQKHEEAAKKAA